MRCGLAALQVIRAYDAMVTTHTAPTSKTTVDERTPLRDAVNLLVSKRALPYDEAYSMIHHRFAVNSIEELEPDTLPAAIEYVHRLALEGVRGISGHEVGRCIESSPDRTSGGMRNRKKPSAEVGKTGDTITLRPMP